LIKSKKKTKKESEVRPFRWHSLSDRDECPEALCVKSEAYLQFITCAGLRERILLEINRKNFKEMRWEEIWDASLRIRNLFLHTPFHRRLAWNYNPRSQRNSGTKRSWSDRPHPARTPLKPLLQVSMNRMSTSEEWRPSWSTYDSSGLPLVRCRTALPTGIGLEIEKSTMAVLIQEIVNGERSGVAFGKNPNDASQAVIEAFTD